MALQHSITLESGITLPTAYARISDIKHTHNELVIGVQWWSSAAARQAEKLVVRSHAFSVPWQETVSLATAYNLLKNEEAFSGAEDV